MVNYKRVLAVVLSWCVLSQIHTGAFYTVTALSLLCLSLYWYIQRRKWLEVSRLETIASDFFAHQSLGSPKDGWLHGKDVLVVMNPIGGSGLAPHLWRRVISPVLEQAGVRAKLLVTQYALHATELFKEMEVSTLKRYSAVIFLCGDSTYCEALDGMFLATNSDQQKMLKLLDVLPMAVLPCGSANTLGRALCVKDLIDSLEGVLTHNVRVADVMQCQVDSSVHFNPISIGVGMLGNLDIYHEDKFRWMGPAIKDVLAPLAAIFLAKDYNFKASLRYRKGSESWVDGPYDAYSHIFMTKVHFLGDDVCLAPGIELDSTDFQLDFIPASGKLWFLKLLLSLDRQGSHQQTYKGSYHFERVTEMSLETTGSPFIWTNAGTVMYTNSLHCILHARRLQLFAGRKK
eukprot:TRINITY_DN6286_c0_g1_i1.p1 TRINITY_DN6286_c0_g1~~TRINITY_DN6286_c0_g1_i1.p1  ORF type:complete len:428 (-),score=71.60 TRINITY_DN6286_c0_g1_i1:12-1217(-)